MGILAVLAIPPGAIDHQRARGEASDDAPGDRVGWRVLVECKPLLGFAVAGLLFHFANGPLLPLVGQQLALQYPDMASAMMSSCIVAAQLVMLPVALASGRGADRWGRKPVLLAAFAILPLRSFLYTLSHDAWWLVAVQLLDGVGAGILSVLLPLIVADLMRGTGRYNMALGAVVTAHGIGAALGGFGAGVFVDRFGYEVTFVAAGIVALAALGLLIVAVPETRSAASN